MRLVLGILFVAFAAVAIADQYTVDIDGAGYTVAVSGGLVIDDRGWASAASYGAVGDGSNDDTSALQAAHDAVEALGGGVVYGGAGKTYKINSTLYWNSKAVGFQGMGCVIDASGLSGAADTPAIEIGGSSSQYGHYQGLSGFRLVGPGDDSNKVGIAFNDTTATYSAKGGSYSVSVQSFGVGLDFRNRAYLLSMYGSEIFDCGIGLRVASGYSDYGENISIYGSAIFNSGVGVSVNNRNCDLHLFGTSLDYNTVEIDLDDGTVDAVGCHFEWSASETVPAFSLGEETKLLITNSHISRGGSYAAGAASIFSFPSSLVYDGGEPVLSIRDNYIWNMLTSTGVLASGLGTVRASGNYSALVPYLDEKFHYSNNYATWGGFEVTSLPRNVYIHTTAESQTDPWTAGGDSITLNASTFTEGAMSAKITKVSGAGTALKVGLITTVSPGQHMMGWRYKMAKETEGGGDITAWDTARWVYWDGSTDATTGVPVIQREETLGQNSYTITDDAIVWAVHEMAISSPASVPSWANALLLTIDLQGFDGTTGGSLYVDDFSVDGI